MLKKSFFIFLAFFLFLGAMPINSLAKNLSANEFLELISDAKNEKVVFINFFASWCPPCRDEIPHLVELRNTYSDDELLIIGINLDKSPEIMEEFVDRMGINYLTSHDSGEIQTMFRVASIPFNLIYAKNGRAVYAKPGLISSEEMKRTVAYAMEN